MLLDDYPSDFFLQFIDANYEERAFFGRQGTNPRSNLSADPRIQSVLDSFTLAAKDPVLSRPIHLADGGTAIAVVAPVFRGSVLTGFAIALVDVERALSETLAALGYIGYSVSVEENSEIIYRTPRAAREYDETWAQSADLELPGLRWNIRVWPDPETLSAIRSPLPELALVLGGVLGLLLMLTVQSARTAHVRSRELREARDRLEKRFHERTVALKEVNRDLQEEISERKRAEHSVRQLSSRLLQLQDEERRRIARELHDSTAQLLAAAAINVDQARQLAKRGQEPKLDAMLGESADFLERATREIRTVSYLLHPPMLDALGLDYTLSWYVEGFSKRSGIAVALDIDRELGRLPYEIELALFRIVQEALTNVHRHSGSRTATITLFRDSQMAMLEITDRGCGIPPNVLDSIPRLGVGIAGMRERVRQLGGTLHITSSGEGTVIQSVLPTTSVDRTSQPDARGISAFDVDGLPPADGSGS